MNSHWLDGYAFGRQLSDGQWLTVSYLTFGRARLHLCTSETILDSW